MPVQSVGRKVGTVLLFIKIYFYHFKVCRLKCEYVHANAGALGGQRHQIPPRAEWL